MKSLCLAVFVLALMALPTHASESDDARLAKVLQQRLDYAYGPLFAAGDPMRLTNELVTRDAIVASGEAPMLWSGREACIALVKDLMKTYKVIKPRAVFTRQLSDSTAYQFVEFELHGEDARHRETVTKAKSLYAWTRTPDGWRIAADLFAPGALEQPL